LCLDSGKRLQDLADEAFRDFLKKHRRPVTNARCPRGEREDTARE
jgi:hypothetical protein